MAAVFSSETWFQNKRKLNFVNNIIIKCDFNFILDFGLKLNKQMTCVNDCEEIS